MKKIFLKFSLAYLIAVTLLSSLIVYISYTTIRNNYIKESANKLLIYSNLILNDLNNYDLQTDSTNIYKILNEFSSLSKIRITIIEKDGNVIFDSEKNPKYMGNHKNRPEILELQSNTIGKSLRYSESLNEDMLYVSKEITNHKKKYYLRTSLFVDRVNRLLYQVRSDIIEISLIVYVISIIVLLFHTKKISKPIKQLSEASKKVADGNFDIKVKLKSKDELGELSRNFNNMTKQLKKLFLKVNSQKEQLDTLITSIREGLVLVDSKGRIKLYNLSFSKIIGNENLIGEKIEKLFNDYQITELISKAIENNKDVTEEIGYKNRQYICSTSWIKAKEELIILLYDMTELNKLMTIKKDFVINVSHELRTPLTAIKGFSETLIDELPNEDFKRYAEIINLNTDRLISIVNDLLTLSEIENSNNSLLTNNVKVHEIINNVYNLFIQKSKEKNVNLFKEIANGERILNVDNFKIEQMLINLIDNAIKYTDNGTITIRSYEDKEQQIFEIEDTGIGIPEEDLDRIYERFYTVDKSRSRQVGGTGLGLSIVKHIALLHKGQITLKSKKNEGTLFKISIPFTQNKIQ